MFAQEKKAPLPDLAQQDFDFQRDVFYRRANQHGAKITGLFTADQTPVCRHKFFFS
jgi:hypothetical protein